MADFGDVYEKVKVCLIDSCGLNEEEIDLEMTLMDDLGIDSIDLLDLIYTLEKQYGITIEVGELAKLAAKEMGDAPFERDNIITDEGLRILQDFIGESQKEKLKKGLTVQELPLLFTVHSICTLVIKKLAAEGR
jgi:acyl carrier protein